MRQPLPLVTRQGDRIAFVAGLRTPFARQATDFHGIPAVELGKMVVGELLARTDIDPAIIEQLVFGQVVQMPEAPNIAREIVLGTGMSVHTDAYSVSRACATSFQAVANVAESIRLMNLKHAVITSVDRDDLPDLGAQHWVDTIRTIKAVNPETTVEVLIPDFQGRLELVDKVVAITNEEAISTARRLMEEEGILAGISSGAAVAAALKLQEDESFTNKNIVVILPSSGERYLSTALFADLFTEKELQQ